MTSSSQRTAFSVGWGGGGAVGTGPCIKMKVLVADEEERNPARQNSAESTAEVILGMDRVPCGPGLF